jgi:hypothetical protein
MNLRRGDSNTTRLDEALDLLPRDVEPARDLWPAIESRLEPRPVPAAHRWLLRAAAAVVLVAASSLITATLIRHADRTPVPSAGTSAGAAPPMVAKPAAFGPGQVLDPTYDAARQQLAGTLAGRIDRLPAGARAKLESNLAELRRATNEINAALALSPGDPLLEELLLNSYQDELAVLASVNQITGATAIGATDVDTRMQL